MQQCWAGMRHPAGILSAYLLRSGHGSGSSRDTSVTRNNGWGDIMKSTLLRTLSICAGAAMMLVVGGTAAQAQADAAKYPGSKPIRVIVGFAAGGGNDIFARMIVQKLQERTGWTVIIENRPGAGGRLHGSGRRQRRHGDRAADLQDQL
jgi:hypothetical protein